VDGGEALQLTFTQPPNRSAIVETSIDLSTWTLWDVPGNAPGYPAEAMQRMLTIPAGADHEFFRFRLSAP
jgi:hypothetical protein